MMSLEIYNGLRKHRIQRSYRNTCKFHRKKIWNFNLNKENTNKNKSLYSLFKDAVNYYKEDLEKAPEIKRYLYDRWMKKESIEKFNIWYSSSWIKLYSYLKQKWYDDETIMQSNIFLDIKTKKDKFLARIIFPLQNLRWDFVALAWRITWEWEPKYLNSPASKIYDKSSTLYWLYEARSSITKQDFVIIVEGYMDTISLQEAGFFNTVSVSWTALTQKHINILKRLTRKIYLCFDNDKAWEQATKLSIEALKNRWIEVRIITIKWAKDPDEAIKKWKDFGEFIKSSLTPIWYYIEKSNFKTESIDEKKKILTELLTILKSYDDKLEEDLYIKEIAKKLDIKEAVVYDSFNKIKLKITSSEEKVEKKQIKSEDIAIWYILSDEKNRDSLDKDIAWKEVLEKDLAKFINSWKKYLKELELEKKEIYRALSLEIEEKDEEQKQIEKIIMKINKDNYKKKIENLKKDKDYWDKKTLEELVQIQKKAKEIGVI